MNKLEITASVDGCQAPLMRLSNQEEDRLNIQIYMQNLGRIYGNFKLEVYGIPQVFTNSQRPLQENLPPFDIRQFF